MYSTEMLIDAFKGLSKEQEEREKVGQPLLELDDIKARLAALSVEIRKETGFAYELRELLTLWDLYFYELRKREVKA